MSIENNKLMNLADGKVLYDDLRGRIAAKHDIPSGGTSGKVLKKSSGTDYDVEWGDVPAATDAQVATAVDAWLDDNVTQETGYVLDRTLLLSNAAAPADLVGDLKSAVNVLEPSATLDDVAKFLKVKTVSGGKVTAYEFGSGSGGGSSGDIYIGTTEPTSGDAVIWINPGGASWEDEMIDEVVAEVLEALPTWSGGSY